jgi:outer membrane protein TolC
MDAMIIRHALIIAAILFAAANEGRGGDSVPDGDLSGDDRVVVDCDLAVAVALKNNFDLKKILAQSEISGLLISEKFRNLFPTLSVSYLEMAEQRRHDTDTRQHRISIDSDVTIYDGGRAKLDYDIAHLQSELGRNDYQIAYGQLIAQVRLQYFQTIQMKKVISIHEKTLEQGKAQLSIMTRETDIGDATALDLLEIQSQLKEIELNLKKAQDDYTASVNQLKLLLRLDWRIHLEPVGDIERSFIFKPLPEDISTDQLVSVALKNRKEVLSAMIEQRISQRKERMSRYYFIPNIIVGFNYNLSDESFFPREKGWGVTLKMTSAFLGNTATANMGYSESRNGGVRSISNNGTLTVLNNMEYRRNIHESSLAARTAAVTTASTSQKIAIDVAQAIESLRNGWSLIDLSKRRVEFCEAILRIERIKAGMGEIRRVDLMKKEIESGQASISYNDSLYKYLTASLTLENSLGVESGFMQISIRREDQE